MTECGIYLLFSISRKVSGMVKTCPCWYAIRKEYVYTALCYAAGPRTDSTVSKPQELLQHGFHSIFLFWPFTSNQAQTSSRGFQSLGLFPLTWTDKRKRQLFTVNGVSYSIFAEPLEDKREEAEIERRTCGYPFASSRYVAPTDDTFDSDGNLLHAPGTARVILQQLPGKLLESHRLSSYASTMVYSNSHPGPFNRDLAGCRRRNYGGLRRETRLVKKTVFQWGSEPRNLRFATKVVFCRCLINYWFAKRCFCSLDTKMKKRGCRKSGTDLVETLSYLTYYLRSTRETVVNPVRSVAVDEPMDVK